MVATAAQPRVMVVGPMPPTKGGVTTFMLNLMGSPLARDVTFVPFTTSRPPKKNVTENWGYRAMLRGGVARIATGALVTLWHVLSFPFAVVSKRVDLVQIQASDYQVFWESAVYLFLARLLGRRVLFRIGGAFDIFHGEASAREQRMIAAVLRRPDVVIAQSSFARDYITQAGRAGTIVQLPNWFPELGLPPEPRTAQESVTCLFIAGLEARRKGIEEVLAAAEMLKARGCDVRFHVVAATPSLLQRIAASHVADRFEAEGPVSRDRVLALMKQCDVFLLPSHGEGFPNSLLEAMATGAACIATPVGAVEEMAAEGGVLVTPVGDAPGLAAAIARLVASADLRADVGQRAWTTVRARYTADTALPKLGEAYQRLMAVH